MGEPTVTQGVTESVAELVVGVREPDVASIEGWPYLLPPSPGLVTL